MQGLTEQLHPFSLIDVPALVVWFQFSKVFESTGKVRPPRQLAGSSTSQQPSGRQLRVLEIGAPGPSVGRELHHWRHARFSCEIDR